ncbi:hypothetical protein BSL78_18837 [Apostichopus japonicus]|uniref:CAP-Gly domain-containing protein n=1 Tax=Stichopus japonicus TaxID=307972 RepID=A0A2G8K8K9_STIJA|nr:hypothetical protein BSL78_18837 [Apostichopus japonicus]
MVLFANINVGQKVQVFYSDAIHTGIVKYKGGLANTKGDWVGVELDKPGNGIYKGRQYFTCKTNHGVFLPPSSIRFNYLKRWHFDTYRSVSSTSFVDETLFHTPRSRSPEPSDPKIISDRYSNLARNGFKDVSTSWHAGMQCKSANESYHLGPPSPTFNRGHSVGRAFKPPEKKRERPKTALGTETFRSLTGMTVRSSTYRLQRSLDLDPAESINRSFSPEVGSSTRLIKSVGDRSDILFASSPSMPKIHMPPGALLVQNQRGWGNAHRPREWTL